MATRAYHSPRRDQAAAETRAAILDAAEELFAVHGYVLTSVGQVAEAARVAANTVYTSVGGKPQLLLALVERALSDPEIARSLDAISGVGGIGGIGGIDAIGAAGTIGTAGEAREVLRLLAEGTGLVMRRHLRVIVLLQDNTSADPLIAEAATRAEARYRERIDAVAEHLAALGALGALAPGSGSDGGGSSGSAGSGSGSGSDGSGSGVEQAGDVLWFYFGTAAWRTARGFGWSWERAAQWLARQAETALLGKEEGAERR